MNLTSRAGWRLAGTALACAAAVFLAPAALAAPPVAAAPGRAAPAGLTAASAAGAAAAPAPRRQLAVTTLTSFRVVLTATRGPGSSATVTAAGYRHTPRGWALIAVKQVGAAGRWSWYATQACSLTVTQDKPGPSSGSPAAVAQDSITVSLLWGPAIGCLAPATLHWS